MSVALDVRRDLAIRIVRRAGRELAAAFGRRDGIEKEPGHVASPVDLEVDALIVREVRAAFPDDALLLEESGALAGSSDYRWVVDPVDGTSNLRAGIPYAACGVALLRGPDAVFSAVYTPFSDELFTGERGAGAFRNGEPIHVSTESEKLVGFYQQGYGAPRSVQPRTVSSLEPVSERVMSTWCPTLDWCNVAAGRADFVVAFETEIEEFVVGRLILEEAGGRVTAWDGAPLEQHVASGARVTFLASNGVVHDAVRTLLGVPVSE